MGAWPLLLLLHARAGPPLGPPAHMASDLLGAIEPKASTTQNLARYSNVPPPLLTSASQGGTHDTPRILQVAVPVAWDLLGADNDRLRFGADVFTPLHGRLHSALATEPRQSTLVSPTAASPPMQLSLIHI